LPSLTPLNNNPNKIANKKVLAVHPTQNGAYLQQQQSVNLGIVDCSNMAVQLCNQESWTDFGLAISGLIPRQSICGYFFCLCYFLSLYRYRFLICF